MKATTRIALAALVATALCAWPTQPSLHAEEIPAPKTIPTSEHAWTLEEALKELKLHPRDPYLQYVALQLARRAGKVEEVAGQLPAANGRSDRSNQVDLFGMFAGALAVQESLQLDTMRGGQGGSGPQASAPAVAPEPYVEVTETCYKTVAKTCYKEDRFQVANFDGTTTEVVKRVPYTVTEQVPYTVTKRVPASKINRSAAEELASEPELAPMPREVPSENDDSDSPPSPSASEAQLPPKCHMDKSPFYLPAIIDDSVRAKLREILLYVKDDPSKPWTLADKGQSSEKVFSFRPEHEGEYWFTVVTVDKMGRQTPPDLTREDPSIIVVYERKPRSEGSSEVEPELVPMPREVEPETPTNNYYEVPPPIVPNVSPLGCLPGNASPFVFSEALLWRAPAARTQIRFTAPAGMKVNWSTVAADGKPSFSKIPVEAPGRYNFQQGAIYRLKLSGIEGRPGLEVYPTLEVVPSNPKTEEFLAHSSVPIDFTHEDFEHVAQGNYLVKVSYLPNQEGLESPTAGVGEVVSTRLQPGTDPIKEAQRRGKSPSLAAETVPGTAVTRMTAVIAEEVPAEGRHDRPRATTSCCQPCRRERNSASTDLHARFTRGHRQDRARAEGGRRSPPP